MERWFSVLKRGRSMQFRVKSKIVKIGGSGRPVVPTEIAETLKVKPGDEVEFVAAKGYVVIKKAKQ
jgi:bifunctional DNA-binding transcriptional regulator/antitoxin component of YhaV-PrlF toxin-antitoxin module